MRILVVEDEVKVANFIKKGLLEERYMVDLVEDSKEAEEQLTNQSYDAMILDVMLPGKDGFELLSELREQGLTIPVIFVTARGSTEDRIIGLDLGGDDYIPKPFSFDELAARLRAVLRRSGPDKSTKLRCGDLMLDTVSHLAYRFGEELELTTKEYALLEFFMRNKNKILSRSTITQHVWKQAFDPESNIIDVYVKRLRTKFEVDDSPPLIQSIRGVGYRMREVVAEEESK